MIGVLERYRDGIEKMLIQSAWAVSKSPSRAFRGIKAFAAAVAMLKDYLDPTKNLTDL